MPGDRPVLRIFGEGIGNCDVFVVVLSTASLTKPWVRDELEAGVVQRIVGQLKLIPTKLEDVVVPIALRSTPYLSIADRGADDVGYRELLSGIYDTSGRPPLGERPQPLCATGLEHLGYSIEEAALLHGIASVERGGEQSVDDEDLARAHPDLSAEELRDLVEGLHSAGSLDVSFYLGGFAAVRPTPHGWRDLAPAFGIDADEDTQALLVHLVAAGQGNLVPAGQVVEMLDGDVYRARMAFDASMRKGLSSAPRSLAVSASST